MPNCKTIAICNQKGGVGKTTTTINLGVGLAMQGKKILLIDADPQGDLTVSLGWKDNDNLETTITEKMIDVFKGGNENVHNGILHHNEGVDVLPANSKLSTLEISLVNAKNRESAMKELVKSVKKDYDYILIDCMPSLNMITLNALVAADSVIIPVQAQYLPARDMTQLLKTVSEVKRHLNPRLKTDGILLTLVDNRTNLAKSTREAITSNFGKFVKIYKTNIPVAVKAAEVTSKGESIFKYQPKCTVAKAYSDFAKEVLENSERQKERLRASPTR